jgi:ketosteroid isomerase-like protein
MPGPTLFEADTEKQTQTRARRRIAQRLPVADTAQAMSMENAGRLRQGLQAWVQSGYSSEVFDNDAFDPQLEWDISAHPLPDWPNTGRGRDQFQSHLANYVAGWRDYQAEIEEVIDAGEEVVSVLHETVAVGDSDAVLERSLHAVWTIREGVVVRVRVFKTKAHALEAAGLTEQRSRES